MKTFPFSGQWFETEPSPLHHNSVLTDLLPRPRPPRPSNPSASSAVPTAAQMFFLSRPVRDIPNICPRSGSRPPDRNKIIRATDSNFPLPSPSCPAHCFSGISAHLSTHLDIPIPLRRGAGRCDSVWFWFLDCGPRAL